jgi:hypothetical protein
VDRRGFITAGAGAGAAALAASPALRVLASLDRAPLPAEVRSSDIDQVLSAARLFSGWGHAYGGDMVREAVTAQLRWSAELLDVKCPRGLRPGLFSAVGYLASVCGFMAFDAYAHADARTLFTFGLACAEQADDWHLRAKLLAACLARQAIWAGDPDRGLTYAEMALVRTDRLAPVELAMLHGTRARALASLGRPSEALHAVAAADDAFMSHEPSEEARWMAYYDAAEHAADTGHCLFDITMHGGGPQPDAAARLRRAVDEHPAAYARSRILAEARLATVLFRDGDPHEASMLGHQALDNAQTLRSHRVADHLRHLRAAASRHQAIPEASELGQRITHLVGA